MTADTQPETQHGFNVAHGHGDPDAGAPVAGEPVVGGAHPDGRHGGSSLHRLASADVADYAVPTGREEDWRFTPLARLRGLHDGSVAADGKVVVEVDAPAGVRVETVGRADPRVGSAGHLPADIVSARAWSAADRVTVVTLAGDERASAPTVVSVRGEGAAGAAYGHVVVVAEPHAEGVVVLDHSGSAVYADNVEVVAGAGANLTVVSVQDWADDAVHASHHHVRVGRDATVKHVAVSFGGDLVRMGTSVGYTGTGGDAELLGLYFADAHQHLEHRLFVDHGTPHCRSNVEYKGALQGEGAHTVWIGDVLIRPEAVGTDTYELNRNLVLTDGARADSVPNLEIETGEVEGAGHASATGRFDDEQLFYLQARGIPTEEARRLVVRGFFASLLNQIGVPGLTGRLLARVERELEESLP